MATTSCFVSVLVARTHDRFALSSFTDATYQQSRGQVAKMACREQVDRVLQRMSVAADGFQSFDSPEVVYYVLVKTASVAVVLAVNKSAAPFQGGHPSGLQTAACSLLDDIQSEFTAMHPAELIAAASRPFQFIKFDTQLTKLVRRATLSLTMAGGGQGAGAASSAAHGRRDAAAPTETYSALKKELQEVHGVIQQNLDDILTRGERLETMQQYSQQLKAGSTTYYKRTVHMNRMRVLKTYGPPAVIILVLLLWLYWRFIM